MFLVAYISVTIHFNIQIVPRLANESSLMLPAVSLSLLFFEHVLTFCHRGMFWAYIELFLSNPGISHFSREPWFLLVENDI